MNIQSSSRLFITIIISLFAAAALACAGTPAASSAAPTQAPPPTQVPTVPSQPAATSTGASQGEVVIEVNDNSVARYIVGERLANRDLPSDAIGETSDVGGIIVFNSDGSVQPDRSKIEINLQTLKSDENRRDNFLRQNSLESNRFPTAEFIVQEASGLTWPLPETGEESFQITGDMTVHGVTQPLTWNVTAQFGPDGVTGQSKAAITFDQFGMSKPSLFFILSVEDEIRMELDFNASVS